MKTVYLDYAATTPVDPTVAARMAECLTLDGIFGNPASLHEYGLEARKVVEEARACVADYIQADPADIIWTSGATESDNLALKGVARLYQRKGRHIVTMKTEHKAVLDTCAHLEKEGFQITYLLPEPDGRLAREKFLAALRPDTLLVSVMHVNNETGVIQDIAALAQETAARGILMHVDAAQTPGKLPLDVSKVPVDLVSLCAHKVYGPKGIGALYLRKKPRVRVEPLIHGGGHEQGMRSGTLATHQMVGMGEAFRLAREKMENETAMIHQLRTRFLARLNQIKNLRVNSHADCTVPHILNLRFEGMLADALLAQIPNLAISTASACQGKGTEGSYVLRAMGLDQSQSKSSMRFSFGRFTTFEHVETAADSICHLFT